MPFRAADADRHNKGLSPRERRQWVQVANSVLERCLAAGGTEKTCAPKAIRQANGVVKKLDDLVATDTLLTVDLPITKSDDTQRRIWGYASIAVTKAGEALVDLQGDVIAIDDLEEAFYDYFKESGELDYMHEGPVRGRLIEGIVFTPAKLEALGLPEGSLPLGAWVGFEIDDPDDYAFLKAAGLMEFSIAGTALREPL